MSNQWKVIINLSGLYFAGSILTLSGGFNGRYPGSSFNKYGKAPQTAALHSNMPVFNLNDYNRSKL